MFKPKIIFYHSLFWAATYLLWVAVFRSYSITLSKTMTVEFCYLIFITADYYAVNNFSIPQFLLKKKYLLFICITVLIVALSAWLRTLTAEQMNRRFFHSVLISDFKTLYLNSFINISVWVLLITIGKMLMDRIQTQRQLEVLEKERVKSELDYLKAQINPHALFNSLNTVYGYIDKNNQTARNILLEFSELLRYQLYDCGVDKVNLGKEIGYIKNYVAFQRLRKDQKLIVLMNIENINTGLMIAPLLLVILIENSFKHVSNFSDKENTICIRIITEGNMFKSTFSNTKEFGQIPDNSNSKGIGTRNLKRRLDLLYNNKYELIVNVNENFYQTNLNIDLS
jgi:two-component system LytT family sensor kinase